MQVAFFKAALFGDWQAAAAAAVATSSAAQLTLEGGDSSQPRGPKTTAPPAINRHTLLMLAAALAARGYGTRVAALAEHVAAHPSHAAHARSRQLRRALLQAMADCGAAAEAVSWGRRWHTEDPAAWDEGLAVVVVDAVTRAPGLAPAARQVNRKA